METEAYKRPSWDEYFLQLAEMVGTRGTCDRGRAGSAITRDKRILSTGYVEVGHEMHTVTLEDGTTSRHCIRTAHAEQNAISNAAREGVALKGGTMYCRMVPCYKCAQSIINVGILRVVCAKDYHGGAKAKEIFAQAGIELVIIKNEVETYKDM